MDRLELVRIKLDQMLRKLQNEDNRKFAYLHLYGVSQCATMLAIQKDVQGELCAISAMLHDISLYTINSGHKDHALKSAQIAEALLKECDVFQEEEIRIITHAISKHSDKHATNDGEYAEILKNADVFAHYLYNPQIPIPDQDKVRLFYLLERLQQPHMKNKAQG